MEIKARDMWQNPVGSRYKPRRLGELSSKDMVDICHSYLVEKLSQTEVAKKYRVTADLVSRLISEHKKMPEKVRDRKQKEKTREKAKDVVQELTDEMLQKSMPITKATQIQE